MKRYISIFASWDRRWIFFLILMPILLSLATNLFSSFLGVCFILFLIASYLLGMLITSKIRFYPILSSLKLDTYLFGYDDSLDTY